MKIYGLFYKMFAHQILALGIILGFSIASYAQPTQIKIEAVSGIGYAVDWVNINYRDSSGVNRQIRREENISLGQEVNFSVPDGATNIVLDAKPLASLRRTRIFNNLRLESGREHCFELRGSVNRPSYTSINCGWVPRGRISVSDNHLNRNIGLKRVKVEVKNKLGTSTIGTTYTDNDGRFRLPISVSGEVKYRVIFQDSAGLKVKFGANSHSQSIRFRAMEGPLNHIFRERDRNNWYWATIYNACQFYKDFARDDGIPMKSDVQVCGFYETGISRTLMTGIQDIVFRLYNRNSREIFNIVMHEMAHVTHASVDRGGYASFAGSWLLVNSLRAAFGESWACGPQAIYTSRRYNPAADELNHHQSDRLADYTYAHRRTRGDHLYIRPIVVDLMDNYNQHNASVEFPVDNVSGYNLQQIAFSLRDAHDLDDWKNNLKRVNNPTNGHLDEYFNQYFEDRPISTLTNTIINIKAVSGIGYAVDWVEVNYIDASGTSRRIRRENNIALGQEATITVPDGATNIRIEAKPLASLRRTRIFNNLNLANGRNHCFHLRGSVNRPRYERVRCGT